MGEDNETEPTSWLETQKEQIKQDMTDFRLKDCEGCRFIGGTVMILAGCYVGYVGQRRAVLKGGGIITKLPSAVVAGVMMSLGIMRLMARNPFSSEESEVGIDLLRRALPKKESDDSSSAT